MALVPGLAAVAGRREPDVGCQLLVTRLVIARVVPKQAECPGWADGQRRQERLTGDLRDRLRLLPSLAAVRRAREEQHALLLGVDLVPGCVERVCALCRRDDRKR